jgi:hypothetical protein
MGGWLILLAAAAVVAILLARSYWWPWGPCPRCTRKGRGKAGRGLGSGGQAWNRCGRCHGSGERIRPLALIWPQHREAARKRREAIGRSRR